MKTTIVLVVALFLLIVIYLSINKVGYDVPEKPKGVPESAVFHGGEDGWVWVACEAIGPHSLKCLIFDQRGKKYKSSYLKPCLNLQSFGEKSFDEIQESKFILDRVKFFEFQKSVYHDPRDESSGIADKYYKFYGVDESCNNVKQ